MKLEIKHIAPYLPFDVTTKLRTDNEYPVYTIVGLTPKGILTIGDNGHNLLETKFEDCLPVLRPLSDLTNEIEHNGEKFVPIERLTEKCKLQQKLFGLQNTIDLKAIDYLKLIEYHFDVFGLIEQGLAVNFNDVKQ